ncbi:MAG: S41 family peptidase [Bacteroidales bacterium]|nr:S41 family peptidase [Bacteroidales bacterium]
MKKYIRLFSLLFILLLSYHTTAQERMRHPDSVIFSREQLREDARFIFKTFAEVHPNIYALSSFEELERAKRLILNQINRPMNHREFNSIMARLNHLLDGHTSIPLLMFRGESGDSLLAFLDSGGKLFPDVRIEDNKIFLKEKYDGWEVMAINNIPAEKIMQEMIPYYSLEFPPYAWFRYELDLNYYLFHVFHIKSPFNVDIKNKKGKVEKIILPGIEYDKKKHQNPPYQYYIYPDESIALLELNTCSMSEKVMNEYFQSLPPFFDSIQKADIRHLFIDVSRNSGGGEDIWMEIFKYIQHKVINLTSENATRMSQQYIDRMKDYYGSFEANVTQPGEVYISPLTKDFLIDKQHSGFYGNLYIIQGIRTYSAGNGLCQIVAQNDLGKLIGNTTGQPGKCYIYSLPFNTPNTKTLFHCSTRYSNRPLERPGITVTPDLYWPVDRRDFFPVKELQEMIKKLEKSASK